MPNNLFRFKKPITFVDGGAYTGDTYSYLLSKSVAIDHWIAFEPDPSNFIALTAFANSQPTRFTVFPCGLSDRCIQVPFAANEGTSSHLSDILGTTEMTVPCVALDEVIHGPLPDYIKLDVEGAERAALLGMTKTIDTSKPCLAVSGYHRPEDLWILIETLAALAPYANLYLRQHAMNAFETVFYAIPRE
jgi:FkbM family methyltransferase